MASSACQIGGDKPKRQKFNRYPIGFFHVDIAEVQTAEGKLYLLVGIDRTSKFSSLNLLPMPTGRLLGRFFSACSWPVPIRRSVSNLGA